MVLGLRLHQNLRYLLHFSFIVHSMIWVYFGATVELDHQDLVSSKFYLT